MRSAPRTASRARIIWSRRRWSSRSTTCSSASASRCEYAPLYRELGLGTTIWSPLSSGLLTGKYNDGIPKGSRLDTPGYEWLQRNLFEGDGPARIEKVKRLALVAREIGVPLSQLAIAWCLKNPHVSTVMLGATKAEQLEENLGALDVVAKLGADEMAKIDAALA